MHQVLVVTLVLVALCCLGSVDSSAYDKIVTHSRIRAKDQGPNVCALQQVEGTNKKYFSTCRNWYKRSICGKKAIVVYDCCPGYMKLENTNGCAAAAPIDHIYGTLGLVKATTTQKFSDMSKLREEIEGKGSFTMFAPSNDAWDQLDNTIRSALVNNVNIEMYNALHLHMVNNRLLMKDMKNGMTVSSMYNDQGLYINHYSNGIVTVNCARIIHGNQVATNGVVHVIDRVIIPVVNTIKDVLDVNNDLTSFNDAVLASGMIEKLDQPGQYTLFAPTNDAFDKLGPGIMEAIMEDKAVIGALVNYHLLTSVQCSEAIMLGSVYETAEGSTIEIGCDGNSLTVNGIKMVMEKDIVTTNGVIHLINQVLIPDSAKEVMDLMGKSQSTFRDMLSQMDFAAALGPKTEYTLLAPPNSAFTSELISKQAVCIENSCMVRGSKEGRNGAFHVIRSIIRPAEKTVYETLIADGRFKIFLSLMETAGLTDLLKQEGSYTVFAPLDDAFDSLSNEDYDLLKSDLNVLRTILLYHISNGIFINGGLEGGVTNLLKTLQGKNLQVLANNSIYVNSVNVSDSDLMATNGVIHVVRNVLYPADLPVGNQDLLILLNKLIRHIKIKFYSGYSYREIPLTFIKKTITTKFVEEVLPKVIEGRVVTRVIKTEGPIKTESTITKVTRINDRPDHSKITTIYGDPNMIDEESERITKIIQEGGKFAAARKPPTGIKRRRTRLVRRHRKPRE
ncbi:hypothetical protein PAMP_007150 [Pampus punctatissimus]